MVFEKKKRIWVDPPRPRPPPPPLRRMRSGENEQKMNFHSTVSVHASRSQVEDLWALAVTAPPHLHSQAAPLRLWKTTSRVIYLGPLRIKKSQSVSLGINDASCQSDTTIRHAR